MGTRGRWPRPIGSVTRGASARRTRPGEPWPVRVDTCLDDGVSADSGRALGAGGVDAALQRRRDRHRRQRRAIVGVRGRAEDRVNHGRLDPKDAYGWRAIQSPDRLTRPLVREGGELVETDWDTAMGRIVERSQKLRGAPRRLGTLRLLYDRPAPARGVLHAGGDRQGRPRHAAHGRQHAAVHRHRRRGAEGELRHRRPAGLLHRRRPLRRDRAVGPQRRRDPGRRCGRGCSTAGAARIRRGCCASTRGRRRSRCEADVHLAPRSGTNLALMNGLLAPRSSSAAGSTRATSPRTRSASTSCERPSRRTRRGASAEICDVPAARLGEAAELARARASACCRPCCRASISQTRRRPRPARSTTCTCCAG